MKLAAAALAALALPLSAAPTAVSFEERELTAMFYSDLGPDEIDVSTYPEDMRRKYETFKRSCSSCHSLARPINSPVASRAGWNAYLLEMRMRSGRKPDPVTREEAKEIVDFLAFDGKLRKLEGRAEFDAQTRRLQKRFWETIVERMSRLQKSGPRSLP